MLVRGLKGMQTALVVLYLAVLLLLCAYGLHRAHLVYLCFRYRKRLRTALRPEPVPTDRLPMVTVQLPLYNEATVTGRLLDAVAKLDYPVDRFEIQVLELRRRTELLPVLEAQVDQMSAMQAVRAQKEEHGQIQDDQRSLHASDTAN